MTSLQQEPQQPPCDLDLENMERVDSSGFGFSNEMSRLIGVSGGVSPIRCLAKEHNSPHVVKVSFMLWLTVIVSPFASQW